VVTSGTFDYLWILARKPELDKETLARLVHYAEVSGFDVSQLEYVVRSVHIERRHEIIDRRYPIGRFEFPANPTLEHHAQWIADLMALPKQLTTLVEGLSEVQLARPYREGGWTVRQVVHHLADSHMNAYCRTRLALTEDRPTVKSYDEKLWAELIDAKEAPINASVLLLDALHQRWAFLLSSLSIATGSGRFTFRISIGIFRLNRSPGFTLGMASIIWHISSW